MLKLKWISFLFSMIFTLFLFGIDIAKAATQPPIPVGRVVWIKGTLKAIMDNKEERILQNKSIIYLHDTLVTDASSQAEVGFTDQTLMTFRENTRFNVTEYSYSPGSKKAGGKSVMNLLEGGFRTITGAVGKQTPNNYAVNTPVATIGVRGTEYQVYIQGDTTYLGYYSGTPCISTRNSQECEKQKQLSASDIDEKKSPPKLSSDTLKKGGYEICLSKQKRWAKVVGPCAKPDLLATKPDAFENDLDMVIAYIEPFTINPNGVGGGNRRSNNFCIQ